MTDVVLDVGGLGGLGDSPVMTAGRVAFNGRADGDEFDMRKVDKSPMYPGSVADAALIIYPRQAVFQTIRDDTTVTTVGDDGATPVWSALNGAGRNDQTKEEFLESVRLVGIAGGDGAKYSSTSEKGAHSPDMTIVAGGLTTMQNTGKKAIRSGDYVVIEFQDPATAVPIRQSPQILPMTVPFDPMEHKLNAGVIKRAMIGRRGTPTVNNRCALGVRQIVSTTAVLVFDALLSSGIVLPGNMGRAGAATRKAAGAAWSSSAGRLDALRTVAKAVRSRGFTGEPSATYMDFMVGEKTLAEALQELACGKTSLVSASGTNRAPPGEDGLIFKNQHSLVEDIMAIASLGLELRMKFGLGVAKTAANPGKEFDILLGRRAM